MDPNELYPHPEKGEGTEKRIRVSVHLSVEDHADIEFFAELWTAYDRAQGIKRKKWKNQSVIERFVKVGLDGLWAQMELERPATPQERTELLQRAVARFKKGLKQK